MSWKFPNPHDASETRERQRVLAQIDRWWQAFQENLPNLEEYFGGDSAWDISGFMGEHLQAIDANLMWEYGPGVEGNRRRLVITPESKRHLRPLVDVILERAPKVEGWTFHPFRLHDSIEQVYHMVQARGGEDFSGATVQAQRGEHNLIDLTFQAPHFEEENAKPNFRDACVATEALLGEEIMERWIGLIRTLPPGEGSFLPLERLPDTVHAVIGSILDQMPPRTCQPFSEEAEAELFEKDEPQKKKDYPGFKDKYGASTLLKDVWMAAHTTQAFYSLRFSRAGERFCYVKIDMKDQDPDTWTEQRARLENQLSAALRADDLGDVWGGGTGLRYQYIDLALLDVPRGAEAVRRVLRAANVAKRSWLQFYDCEWELEWIGIWDDTPKPPMPLKN
jgi:hypothetical protein